jgi:transposase InsO family protein
MMDFAAKMSGCRIFSKVDLRKGYHQIPMHARDIAKMAIITPFGLYDFLRMGFGLRNAGNTFQRMMDRVTNGLPFIFVYLDDIIVGSPDLASHLQHLQLLFQRLREFGLVINGEMCEFGAKELDFLSHRVSAEGVAPLKKKVDALLEHPRPQTVQELHAFLGTVNFHLSYIAEYTSDIRHIPGKENVVADTMSRPPATSHTAGPVGAHTAGPDSRLTARPACAHTAGPDSCLTAGPASTQTTGPYSSAWLEETLAGLNSLTAEVPPACAAEINFSAMAAEQPHCGDTQATKRSTSLQVVSQQVASVSMWCDISTGKARPLVPACHRQQVFAALHGVAHPGIRASRRLISHRFLWKGMRTDIANWCRDCQACQRSKTTRQPAAAVQPIPVPSRRFSHTHVDLVGPLPTSAEGWSYIMTMMDRSTRWLEATPVQDMAAATCADTLIAAWVARFGVPAVITSDRGTQFTSQVWTILCRQLGIQHTTTTAYHLQSNGLVERAHRQLKEGLKTRLASHAWPAHLPWVLLGMRTTPKDDSAISSAELVYGASLVLPGEFVDAAEPPAANFLEHMRPGPVFIPTRPIRQPQQETNKQLQQALWVYIRRGGALPPLTPLYASPYEVTEAGAKTFEVMVGGQRQRVSVDRLKLHTGPAPVTAANPARCGRPPKEQTAVVAATPRTYAEVVAGGGSL